jgi:gamma-glutamylputrescine oxidase
MTEHTTSYYASANQYEPFPTLSESVSCDVCVVGGGYTGLLRPAFIRNGLRRGAAWKARELAGASGRNGGQLVNSYSRDIDVIENLRPGRRKMLAA